MTLDEARKALFVASRALQKAHGRRQAFYLKQAPPEEMVQACRDADRELQRAAIRFTAALLEAYPSDLRDAPTIADIVRDMVAFVEEP